MTINFYSMRLILKRMVNLSLKPAAMSIQFQILQDQKNTAVVVVIVVVVVVVVAIIGII